MRAAASMPLGQVSVDLHGPYPIKSLGGHSYVMVLVDGCSRYTYCRLLRKKTETTQALKEYCQEVGAPREILCD